MAYGASTVDTSADLIIAANPNRVSLTLTNASSDTAYIGLDASVATTTGTPLLQNIVFYYPNSSGTKMYTGPVYGITAANSASIRYIENTIQS